jgi:hypothetical protein
LELHPRLQPTNQKENGDCITRSIVFLHPLQKNTTVISSDIYSEYAFATKLRLANRPLPQVHIVVKNRITQYMGPASAYDAVLRSIEQDVSSLIHSNPDIFTFDEVSKGVVEIRDFQTTGVVAFARGCPFYKQINGKLNIGGHRVQVQQGYRQNCVDAIDDLVRRL